MNAKKISIGGISVGPGEPCAVVAEIGINHNGNVETVKQLIDLAVKAHCQAVKFQMRTVRIVYTSQELVKPRTVPASLVQEALKRGVLPEEALERLSKDVENTTNGDLKWALEFTLDEYREIIGYCKLKNILWFASPWDEEAVSRLEALDVSCYKIAAACNTDRELLLKVKATGKPIILSTGMTTLDELDRIMAVLDDARERLVLMHTVSTYPSDRRDLNLSVIQTLQKRYGVSVGYSGHENGTTMTVCAVAAYGACIVERHITLDRTMWGSDQAASLEQQGLTVLVKNIRDFEAAKGDGIKRVIEAEQPIKKKLRRVETV